MMEEQFWTSYGVHVTRIRHFGCYTNFIFDSQEDSNLYKLMEDKTQWENSTIKIRKRKGATHWLEEIK